jgi:deoxyribodipyrimidine photo-lyase
VATGWLNAPMRAMVLAVAAQHLGQGGQDAGTVLARACTDYDPAIHWPRVRQVFTASESGPLRICNPIRQGQVLDPDGTFTRRWLPELATVPDAFLHEPWKWPGAPRLLGRRYPEPVVDIAASVRAMRGARLLRRAPDAGARLPAGPIRQRKPVPGQMSLDL